ncbi:MAG: hypothetical protein ACE37F_09095 [Nannocystaceae bacterium]|nr:hypothetical protein [bacterium]
MALVITGDTELRVEAATRWSAPSSSSRPRTFSVADVSLMRGSYSPTTAPLHFIEVDDFEFCSMPFGA